MTEPLILDGRWLASLVQSKLREEVEELALRAGRRPGLGVILVGDNPASKAYVRRKEKVAEECGFAAFDIRLPVDAEQGQVAEAIQSFNDREEVDGILLQLPVPKGLREKELLDSIQPQKDVDGLHPVNQGLLLRGEGELRPCTPVGVMKLVDLAYSGMVPGAGINAAEIPEADLSGVRAVVVGRSILVGKAAAMLLLERNATVTIVHSKTQSPEALCREADIVIAAVGVPKLIGPDWIKQGAVVIDVGINRTESGALVGDVDFDAVRGRCRAITPVPGGVGQMTVAMLMVNTLSAYKQRMGLQ